MDLRNKPAGWHLRLAFLATVSVMGCWQEVRYELDKTDSKADQVEQTESRTKNRLHDQADPAVKQQQANVNDTSLQVPTKENPAAEANVSLPPHAENRMPAHADSIIPAVQETLPEDRGPTEKNSGKKVHADPPPQAASTALTGADESMPAAKETLTMDRGPEEKGSGVKTSADEVTADRSLLDDLFPIDPPISQPTATTPAESSSPSPSTIKQEAIEPPTVVPSPSRTALAAWQLGSQWSMGAALFAKGLPAKQYEPEFEQAAAAAQLLHLKLTALPSVAADKDPVSATIAYLLDEQGPMLAEKLETQYDTRHAALMKLAIRSNLLLLIYSPHNLAHGKGLLDKKQFQTWIERLTELAGNSALPESVWKPLLDGLRTQAPYAQVKQDIFKLHRQAKAKLASLAG